MCGIFGFNWEDKNLLERMDDVLSHRGPDNQGYFIDKNLFLGHRRLSIIDVSKKRKQPIFNENQSLSIIYNGELYNYKEIKEYLEKKLWNLIIRENF